MTDSKLTDSELRMLLPKLPGWTVAAGKLHREYRFADFSKAWEFMKAAVPEIETMNHHPEWFNVYNRVVVDLTTHDAGGISRKDFDLAAIMERIAGRVGHE